MSPSPTGESALSGSPGSDLTISDGGPCSSVTAAVPAFGEASGSPSLPAASSPPAVPDPSPSPARSPGEPPSSPLPARPALRRRALLQLLQQVERLRELPGFRREGRGIDLLQGFPSRIVVPRPWYRFDVPPSRGRSVAGTRAGRLSAGPGTAGASARMPGRCGSPARPAAGTAPRRIPPASADPSRAAAARAKARGPAAGPAAAIPPRACARIPRARPRGRRSGDRPAAARGTGREG